MLGTSDLIHLPYTPDLTEGGISVACCSLACSSDRMGAPGVDPQRRNVASLAVELAFRRHLSERAVPFRVLGMTPFTRPERYDILLGGHRCIVQSYLVSHRKQITRIRRNPVSLLKAPALIPVEQFAGEDHRPDDLYLFAFLLGLVTPARTDVDKAIAASQPVFLVHLLPEAWARPGNRPLPKLSLKSECGASMTVEIGGQDREHNFFTATLELPPRQRVLVQKEFHSLAFIHVQNKPEARIGIHTPRRGEPYLIPAHAWENLWVYGMDIVLTGWLTHEDFRRKARVLNTGARTLQFDQLPLKSLLVPVEELNPLGGLLEKVRRWEAEKSGLRSFS